MIWECALVDVGVSEQRTLFLKESTEAWITCPYQKLLIGGRMSWEGGEVCGGGALCHTVFLGAASRYRFLADSDSVFFLFIDTLHDSCCNTTIWL